MYFITNRAFNKTESYFEKFLKHANPKGPNELHAFSVTGTPSKPVIEQVNDVLKASDANNFIKKYSLDLPLATDEKQKLLNKKNDESSIQYYASLKVACDIFGQARKEKKSVLFYVHGYNNDVKDVYQTALEIEKLYGVIVVVFTWPANGGGVVSGTLSYLADKRDARASKDALDRTIGLIADYHALLTNGARQKIQRDVEKRYCNNPTKQRELFAKKIESYCKVSVSMMCHSMGNYVLKHALNSELAYARNLVFDNIALVAADANNELHNVWVETLQVRHSLYIVINENDYALSWSRRKPGEQQKARLGHYLKNLNAKNAVYVDMSRERAVSKSHSYFDGETSNKNAGVKRFFKSIFSGESVSHKLDFIAHNNTYRPK
jgi:esterase/lipase superfamily enzyme